MYDSGELIVYGNTGVCKVEKVITADGQPPLDYLEAGRRYYQLSPVYQSGTIFTPADEPKVFMRPVITAEQAENLIDKIPDTEAPAFHSSSVQELKDFYNAAAKSHNCADLLWLVKSIHTKQEAAARSKRRMGHVDERFMKQAEDMISSEFAVALGIPKDTVNDYIAKRVAGLAADN